MKSKIIFLIFASLFLSLLLVSMSRALETDTNYYGDEKAVTGWLMAVMVLSLILLITIAVYFSLKVVYKNKYETYLFKNKNNFYNLINYVHHSKSEGWSNKNIISLLKKSGWKTEQINYVIEEYAGKSRNFAEIPIDKLLGKSKKKPLSQGEHMPESYK